MTLVALVRIPGATLYGGERAYISRKPIDIDCAREQHANYVDALSDAGAKIVDLPKLDDHPDSVFVEDTAIVLDGVAVMGRSRVPSRQHETPSVAAALSRHYYLARPPEGATLDGGDVLVIERAVYVGLTTRTNAQGVAFLQTYLRQHQYDVIPVPVSGCLHLKTGITYLGGNTVLINPQWIPRNPFAEHAQIAVEAHEPMAANALLVGQRLLMSASYPATFSRVESYGFRPHALDVSEFHRAEGGLTCLSILLHATR